MLTHRITFKIQTCFTIKIFYRRALITYFRLFLDFLCQSLFLFFCFLAGKSQNFPHRHQKSSKIFEYVPNTFPQNPLLMWEKNIYRHFSVELITVCLRNVILTCSCSRSRFPLDTGCAPSEKCSQPTPFPHASLPDIPLFLSLFIPSHVPPAKRNRLGGKVMLKQELTSDPLLAFKLEDSSVWNAGEAHHSSCVCPARV